LRRANVRGDCFARKKETETGSAVRHRGDWKLGVGVLYAMTLVCNLVSNDVMLAADGMKLFIFSKNGAVFDNIFVRGQKHLRIISLQSKWKGEETCLEVVQMQFTL
jgi:RimJ/RimL family protein N-acetyltransferase